MLIFITQNKLYICIFFIFLTGCSINDKNDLSRFFNEVIEQVDNSTLKKFKNLPIDSAGQTVLLVYNELLTTYKTQGSKYNLGLFSDSTGRIWHDSIRLQFLTIAFHSYCNNDTFDLEKLKLEYNKMSHYQLKKRMLRDAEKDLKLALYNSSNCNVGDTINVCLPYDTEFVAKRQYYYGGIISDSSYFRDANIFSLSGIVLSKEKGESNPMGHDFEFKLKVLDVSEKNIIMSGSDTVNIGGKVKLNVTLYRRVINKGMTKGCKIGNTSNIK